MKLFLPAERAAVVTADVLACDVDTLRARAACWYPKTLS